MKLMKCSNNHYYDGDVYTECPHCGGGKEDDTMTERIVRDRAKVVSPAGGMEARSASAPSANLFADNDLKGELEDLNVTERIVRPRASANTAPVHATAPVTPVMPATSVGDDDEGKTMRISLNASSTPNVRVSKEPLVGWLVGLNGEVYGEGFPLVTGKNFIGRGADMDVVIRGDMSISRSKHAVIIYDPRGRQFLVQPGDSKSLFYMNDKLVLDTMPLENGTILCLGDTKLKFVAFCGEDFAWETNE